MRTKRTTRTKKTKGTTRTRELPRTTQLPFYQYYIYAKSDGKRLMTSAVAITPEISLRTPVPAEKRKSKLKMIGRPQIQRRIQAHIL